MTRRLLAGIALVLALACTQPFDLLRRPRRERKGREEETQEEGRQRLCRHPIPDKAGPDYAIQGEYVGETADKEKLGAEVVARGDGNFMVNFLPGGLRGEGGDYSKHVDATAKKDGETTTVTSKDGKWTATVNGSMMSGKTAEGTAFTLKHVGPGEQDDGARNRRGRPRCCSTARTRDGMAERQARGRQPARQRHRL